ncbi:MAG TPA: hypothetical protein PKK10_02225 [Woeseiaceae bacterium]|nr:hypothetical protein [Woeseiaceae bacterium]
MRWLRQADLTRVDGPQELLTCLLAILGKPPPHEGLAALRLWGQTGDRPAAWMAAADPVYLEPRRDDLVLHALDHAHLGAGELRDLFDHLQTVLGPDGSSGFARVGYRGYLNVAEPIATAELSAATIDGRSPDSYLPAGINAAGQRKILSEIEMALHEQVVNVAREAAGRVPVNSLWIWGGGTAPLQVADPHPPLFSDDALLLGYWSSKTAHTESWPGTIAACLAASVAGFVAVVPDDAGDASLPELLRELKSALRSGRLSKLTLLFRDGVRADVRRAYALRVWRRHNTLLDAESGDSDSRQNGVMA